MSTFVGLYILLMRDKGETFIVAVHGLGKGGGEILDDD